MSAGAVLVVADTLRKHAARLLPNPAIRLPSWRCLERFDRWRCERGILTGRWTQAEVDDIRARAKAQHEAISRCFDDAPPAAGWVREPAEENRVMNGHHQ